MDKKKQHLHSSVFDRYAEGIDKINLKVFSKNNPDPKTPLRRHYLSLVGLLQLVDIMNDEFDWKDLPKDRHDAIQKYIIDHGITERTLVGMINQCIGDLDTRMAVFQKGPSGKNWFWCENLYDGENTLHITANGDSNYEYSFDGIEWTEYDGVNDPEFTNKIYVRALPQEKFQINCSKDFGVGGNAMSLLYGSEFTGEETEFPEDGTFYDLFGGAVNLYHASELILPATKLAKGCYEGMFEGCSNLLGALELPAKSFATGCYNAMFCNCANLTEVKIHIEGEWDSTCTYNWLDNVAETGILYNLGGATNIPTNDVSGCPDGWTIYPNPNTVPGEEPSNPIDVTGTELEQLLEQDPVQGVQDMGGMQGVPYNIIQGVQGSGNGTQGTQGTPEEEEEEEELKPIKDKKSSTPQTAQIGYFYNVTVSSKRFAKGVYTIIDKSNAVPFTAAVTEKEFEKLINEGSLVPDTTYFVLSSKGNTVCYASSTKDADKIFQQPTGWTPKNPIMVTGQELDDLIDRDMLNDGYFYNITDTTGTEYDTGLYVAFKGDVEPFDWNNIVTQDQLSQMAADEKLTPNAIYYISDYYGEKETDAVVWAETNSKVVTIERSRTPKPIPGPEPDPKGWTFNDPIVCDGKELNGYIESSTLYQYYFYYADSDFEQIKAKTTYLAIDKNKVVEFDKNNAQLDEEIQKMEQLETLTPNAYYFAINTEVIYLAVGTKTLEQIERTPVSDK